jgi:cell shape-determining protein MreD
VSPNYGTIVILVIVLKADYRTAFPAAFIVGLVIDSLNPSLLGVGTAVRLSIAAGVWELKRKLDLERIPARLYLLMGSELAYQLVYQALTNEFNLAALQQILLTVSLPTLIYTTVVGVLVLLLSDLSVKIEIGKSDSGTKAA